MPGYFFIDNLSYSHFLLLLDQERKIVYSFGLYYYFGHFTEVYRILFLRSKIIETQVFTFNIRDYQALARQYPNHSGLLLAMQNRWTVRELIDALDQMLKETEAEEWIGQVRWLNDWRA